MRVLLRRLRYLCGQRQADTDLAAELEFHREMKQRELEAGGLAATEARFAARRALGSVALARDQSRDVWIRPWLDSVWQDTWYALGNLWRQRGVAAVAVVTLTLGIGANTAIFSVVNTVLLKPFVYTDPERLVMFQNMYQQGGMGGTASPTEFNWWRQQTGAVQDVSAYAFTVANFTGEAFPEQVQATRVSADFFRLCGANALQGRTFTAEDDLPNVPKTVVLAF
jgi:putative ABC transport system permease protein